MGVTLKGTGAPTEELVLTTGGQSKMGTLTYDSIVIEFDDRLLAHLQIVIVNKLRRRESFAMSWRDAPEVGDGRSAIWLDPSIPLYFKFDGSRIPAINRDWVEQLAESAASSHGLVVMGEDGELSERPARIGTSTNPIPLGFASRTH